MPRPSDTGKFHKYLSHGNFINCPSNHFKLVYLFLQSFFIQFFLTWFSFDFWFRGNFDFNFYSDLLDESWEIKKRFSNKINSEKIEYIINKIKKIKNFSLKLCGAGAGGFLLVNANHNYHQEIKNKLNNLQVYNFKMSFDGVMLKKL